MPSTKDCQVAWPGFVPGTPQVAPHPAHHILWARMSGTGLAPAYLQPPSRSHLSYTTTPGKNRLRFFSMFRYYIFVSGFAGAPESPG